MKNKKRMDGYNSVLGQYVLTSKVFELRGRDIAEGKIGMKDEYRLTSVLKEICNTEEMMACRINGRRYDIVIHQEYLMTMVVYRQKKDKRNWQEKVKGWRY